MILNNVRIVLLETSHPGNIGSSARAMKTMGLSRLYLVNPKHFPDSRATDMSAGADDLLTSAVVTDTLSQALSGVQLVIGASARARGVGLPPLSPSDCASFVCEQADDTEVALIFGRECSGLTNEELMLCHYHMNIPSVEGYSSLNLSQAVQIMAYELRMKHLMPAAHTENRTALLAKTDDVERMFQHLERVLIDIEFLKPKNPRRLLYRLRRMFNRIQLEDMEVSILRGMLTQIEKGLQVK